MNFLDPKTQSLIAFFISVIAGMITVYSSIIFSRLSQRRGNKTYKTNAIASRYVKKDDFLLSLIATYDKEVKKLLDPPPDEIIIAVMSDQARERPPRGMVIAKSNGCSREVTIQLSRESPVRPLFEAILQIQLDDVHEVEPNTLEETHLV